MPVKMGHKAVGSVCWVMHVKDPSALNKIKRSSAELLYEIEPRPGTLFLKGKAVCFSLVKGASIRLIHK